MRESIGTTTTFQYVLIFTLVMVAFLTLAITYNRVYKIKNESISIIEKYEGIYQNGNALSLINNYLYSTNYTAMGHCEDGEYGVASLDGASYELAESGTEYYYCLSAVKNNSTSRIYYTIRLFFKFNLPVIGEIFTFDITGETGAIKYYDSAQMLG